MPATTPRVQIPYPVPGDPPDAAGDFNRLAMRVDALIYAIGGNPLGSLTPWWDNNGPVPAGYLRCVGGTFDPLAYPDLAVHLGSNNIPDLRGKFLRGAGGNFPGLNQTGGWDDAVVAPHTHTVPDHQHTIAHTHDLSSHTHTMKNHTHGGRTVDAGAHLHNLPHGIILSFYQEAATEWRYNATGPYEYRAQGQANTVFLTDGTHGHDFGTGGPSDNTSDGPSNNGSGPSSSPNTGFLGNKLTTDGLNGTAVAGTHLNRNLPPFMNVTWLIRATNDVV